MGNKIPSACSTFLDFVSLLYKTNRFHVVEHLFSTEDVSTIYYAILYYAILYYTILYYTIQTELGIFETLVSRS